MVPLRHAGECRHLRLFVTFSGRFEDSGSLFAIGTLFVGSLGIFEMKGKGGWVYMLASRPNGVLYVGVTEDLVRRVWEHREGLVEGFTKKHGVKTLVWFERHETILGAIAREKVIKNWPRAWKVRLIMKDNFEWADLYEGIV